MLTLPTYLSEPLVFVEVVLLKLSFLDGGVQIFDCTFVFFLLWSLFCMLSQIYGFWLFLLCRLITPLVSYDSPFGTFWLPLWYFFITLWYLLLTHLVHRAYLFGTFWLPLWYPLPTLLVSSGHPLVPTAYPFGTFSLPLYFLRDTPFFILPTLLLPSR